MARVAALSPFAQYLEAGGCDFMNQLSATGIAPETLGAAENLIPFLPACEFIHAMGRQCGDESLGLEVGSRTSISGLGMFGTLLCQSMTLKDLIEKMVRWVPALNSGARVWTESTSDPETFRFALRHEAETGRLIADGYALLLLIDTVRMAAGPEWQPKKASFDRAGGNGLQRFEALSEAEFDRDVDHVAIEIPSKLLSASVHPPKKKCGADFVEDTTLTKTAPSEDLVGSISQAIQSGLATRVVTIQHAAEMAGMGVRMLQRKLSAKGLVYSDLVDRVRFQNATKLLRENDVKLAEISQALGYSDPTNFSHAFNRWSGISPSQYRAKMLQGYLAIPGQVRRH